jgi:hypothetical protein
LTRPGGEFIQVDLSGKYGHLTLSWLIDVEASQQIMVLNSKFLLATNDRPLSYDADTGQRLPMVNQEGSAWMIECCCRRG